MKCPLCGEPIDYGPICIPCEEQMEMAQEIESNIVTKDMASDAGDPDLEGQEY